MGDPLSIAAITIAVAATATAAATSAAQAKTQNEAARAQAESTRQAVAVGQQQLSEQASMEKRKRLNESNALRSRLRVAAGESGIGTGGTFLALNRQIDFDLSINQDIINKNFTNNIDLLRSGAQAQLNNLVVENTLLAGFGGGVQGAQAGLQIAGGLRNISAQQSKAVESKGTAEDSGKVPD